MEHFLIQPQKVLVSRRQKRNRKVVGTGAQILRSLGLSKIRSIGTPTKYSGLQGFHIEIEELVKQKTRNQSGLTISNMYTVLT